MKAEIKNLGEIANYVEVKLRRLVMDLDNHMNGCECDDAVKYDFSNTSPYNAVENRIFCLNCGGFITPNEMEM